MLPKIINFEFIFCHANEITIQKHFKSIIISRGIGQNPSAIFLGVPLGMSPHLPEAKFVDPIFPLRLDRWSRNPSRFALPFHNTAALPHSSLERNVGNHQPGNVHEVSNTFAPGSEYQD